MQSYWWSGSCFVHVGRSSWDDQFSKYGTSPHPIWQLWLNHRGRCWSGAISRYRYTCFTCTFNAIYNGVALSVVAIVIYLYEWLVFPFLLWLTCVKKRRKKQQSSLWGLCAKGLQSSVNIWKSFLHRFEVYEFFSYSFEWLLWRLWKACTQNFYNLFPSLKYE